MSPFKIPVPSLPSQTFFELLLLPINVAHMFSGLHRGEIGSPVEALVDRTFSGLQRGDSDGQIRSSCPAEDPSKVGRPRLPQHSQYRRDADLNKMGAKYIGSESSKEVCLRREGTEISNGDIRVSLFHFARRTPPRERRCTVVLKFGLSVSIPMLYCKRSGRDQCTPHRFEVIVGFERSPVRTKVAGLCFLLSLLVT